MTSHRTVGVGVALLLLACGGCAATEDASPPGSSTRSSPGSSTSTTDPTPTKLDGTESHEFEQDDLKRAEDASDAVKEYCADAVSEAQRLGCESHVTDADLP